MTFSFLLIKKFFPVFNAFLILIFSLLAIFLFQFSFIFYLVFSSLVIILSFFFLFFILGKEAKAFWPLLIFFPLLIAAVLFFLIFLRDQPAKILFIFITSFISYLFLITLFRFLHEPRKYPPHALENFSFSLSFVASFLIFSIGFALLTLLNFRLREVLPPILLSGFFLTAFLFWALKQPIKKTHILIVGLIVLELFYAMTFLPTSFYINGLILTILFFAMINLINQENKDGLLTSRVIKKHILLTSLLLLLVGFLAKWR